MREKIAKMKEDLLPHNKDNKEHKKKSKKKLIKKVSKKNDNIKKNSATKIQSIWRGYKIQKQLKKIHLAEQFINKISNLKIII